MSNDDQPSPTESPTRVLVCIGYNPDSRHLIERATRLANAFGGELFALHIQASGSLAPGYRTLLEANLQIAEDAGATVLTERGYDIAETIGRVVREKQITHIVMGESARSRLSEIQKGSLVRQLLHVTTGVDMYIVADCLV